MNKSENKLPEESKKLLESWMEKYSELFGRVVSAEMFEVYVDLVADIPPDRLAVGLKKAAQTCTRFPTVADIRIAAGMPVERRMAAMPTLVV